jgi:hypothetical protein
MRMDIENSPGARVHPGWPAARDDYVYADDYYRAAGEDVMF